MAKIKGSGLRAFYALLKVLVAFLGRNKAKMYKHLDEDQKLLVDQLLTAADSLIVVLDVVQLYGDEQLD